MDHHGRDLNLNPACDRCGERDNVTLHSYRTLTVVDMSETCKVCYSYHACDRKACVGPIWQINFGETWVSLDSPISAELDTACDRGGSHTFAFKYLGKSLIWKANFEDRPTQLRRTNTNSANSVVRPKADRFLSFDRIVSCIDLTCYNTLQGSTPRTC